jgi:hypothetical protein
MSYQPFRYDWLPQVRRYIAIQNIRVCLPVLEYRYFANLLHDMIRERRTFLYYLVDLTTCSLETQANWGELVSH